MIRTYTHSTCSHHHLPTKTTYSNPPIDTTCHFHHSAPTTTTCHYHHLVPTTTTYHHDLPLTNHHHLSLPPLTIMTCHCHCHCPPRRSACPTPRASGQMNWVDPCSLSAAMRAKPGWTCCTRTCQSTSLTWWVACCGMVLAMSSVECVYVCVWVKFAEG